MALAGATSSLQKDLQSTLEAAFAREFSAEAKANGEASDAHKRLAKAISDIAIPIISTIVSQSSVVTSGGSGNIL